MTSKPPSTDPQATDRQASERRSITVDDLWEMERLSSPALSPDGMRVAFTVTRFSKDDDTSTSHLWLAPVGEDDGEPRQLTQGEKSKDRSPAFSPDGDFLFFRSKRGDGPPQLYRLPMAGGEAERLTDLPVAVEDFRLFPDGRRVVFAAETFPDVNDDFEALKKRVEEQKKDKTKAKISDRRLLRFWDEYRTNGRVPHFFVLDLESGEIRDLTPGLDLLVAFRDLEWDLAPDGAELAFAANVTEPPWQTLRFDVHLVDVERGETRRLSETMTLEAATREGEAAVVETVDGEGPEAAAVVPWNKAPRYSPDGRHLLFHRIRRPRMPADFSRLLRLDRESGEAAEVLPGWDGELGRCRVTPDGQTVLFHAQNRGRMSLYATPIAGGTENVEPRLLVRGGTTTEVVVGSVLGGHDPGGFHRAVFFLQSITSPPELVALDLNVDDQEPEGEPWRLTSFHDDRMAQIELPRVEDMVSEGAHGDEVQTFLLEPPGFDPEKKWPLLVLVHGGPYSAWLDAFFYRWNGALFASPGYVVALVNFHGSTGFGQDFAASIVGNHAEAPFEDVERAVDAIVDRGYIDEDRIAAAGGSYGGYLISWILGHSDRFQALVNHAGVYDLMAQYASDYTWTRDVNYGAAPWEDPAQVDRFSPSRHAASFDTPTLILHGERDYRVPATQGINLYHVLQGRGVPSRIVLFPRENHWISKPQAAEIWWREVLGWLETYIGQGPTES